MPAHHAVAHAEVPGRVDGNRRATGDETRVLLDRERRALAVPVEGEGEDHGVARQTAELLAQLGDGPVREPVEGDPIREDRSEALDDGRVRESGGRLVAHHDHPPGLRMEPEGELQGLPEVGRLVDAGVALLSGETGVLEVVHAAEDDRYPGKQVVPMVQQEVEGVVVAREDDLRLAVAILQLVEAAELRQVLVAEVALRVHVLDEELEASRRGELARDALRDAVRPREAGMVGVEDQDAAGGLAGGGPGEGDEGEQHGKEPESHRRVPGPRRGRAPGEEETTHAPPSAIAFRPIPVADRFTAPRLTPPGSSRPAQAYDGPGFETRRPVHPIFTSARSDPHRKLLVSKAGSFVTGTGA
jgi:hypothetical protein